MTNMLGTGIFWNTLIATAMTLALATLLGRALATLLPYKLKAAVRFYLAPVLGLAILTIIASLLGRIQPLGDSVILPLIIILLLLIALFRERHFKQTCGHLLWVCGFGIICGVTLLGPLFVYGIINTPNDTFTYLAHSAWLQEHAFSDLILPGKMTPLQTQIYCYQVGGYRMGASFLLACMQALLNFRWAYEIYPALVIAIVTSCCLALGFPLAQALRSMRRCVRLALLALPAFTAGGLIFGANFGFLPQTTGLAFSAGFLFLLGALLRRAATGTIRWKTVVPSAVLLAATIFAYSELTPFLVVSILGSSLFLAIKVKTWKGVLLYLGLLSGMTAIILNVELLRVYAALRTQSSAVVGGPVDWSLLGYIAHAFGLHGGAWDPLFQWTLPGKFGTLAFIIGVLLLGGVLLLLLTARRTLWCTAMNGALTPAIVMLALFAAGLCYFRYGVPSPFPQGVGQSWSQFKLSDWAHPFVMVFVLLAVAHQQRKLGKLFNGVVFGLCFAGLISTTLGGVVRIKPFLHPPAGEANLNHQFYLDFRRAIQIYCPPNASVYLALGGQYHKIRQMAALYLYDRDVTSDWSDDVYISPYLPMRPLTQTLIANSCIVEPISQYPQPDQKLFGPFSIGLFNNLGQIKITSALGGHGKETDGNGWWHWVEHNVSFQIQPLSVPANMKKTKVSFEFSTRGDQTLNINLRTGSGVNKSLLLPTKSSGDGLTRFLQVVELPPQELAAIDIVTDGEANTLGEKDSRLAAFRICNLVITPLPD